MSLIVGLIVMAVFFYAGQGMVGETRLVKFVAKLLGKTAAEVFTFLTELYAIVDYTSLPYRICKWEGLCEEQAMTEDTGT